MKILKHFFFNFSVTIEKPNIQLNEIDDMSINGSLNDTKRNLHNGITQRSEPLTLNDRGQRNPADRKGFMNLSGNRIGESYINNEYNSDRETSNNVNEQGQNILKQAAAKLIYPQDNSGIPENDQSNISSVGGLPVRLKCHNHYTFPQILCLFTKIQP